MCDAHRYFATVFGMWIMTSCSEPGFLDMDATPSAAFRACFDEPVLPTVAERVKMTALAGGDYVLTLQQPLQL